MSHSKEILTVTRWRADDGTVFATQEEAEKHEDNINMITANGKAERSMTDYIAQQVKELINFENQVNSIKSDVTKITQELDAIRRSISQLNSELKSLENIPKKDVTKEIKDRIEKLRTEIASLEKQADEKTEELKGQTEKLDLYQGKMDNFRATTYAPFLEAWGGYESEILFLNEYEALKNLVIDNTSIFISLVSQIGDEIGIGDIKLGKDNWWGTDDGRFDGPGDDEKRVLAINLINQ